MRHETLVQVVKLKTASHGKGTSKQGTDLGLKDVPSPETRVKTTVLWSRSPNRQQSSAFETELKTD